MSAPRIPRDTTLTPLQVAFSLVIGLMAMAVVAGVVMVWVGSWR